MTGEQFVAWHLATVTRMNEICKAKNQDYSGGGNTYAFANFMMVEHLGIGSVEQGFLTRMTDKLARISNLIKNRGAAVKDESIQDTLLDLANYSILMAGYLADKHCKDIPRPPVPPELRSHEGRSSHSIRRTFE